MNTSVHQSQVHVEASPRLLSPPSELIGLPSEFTAVMVKLLNASKLRRVPAESGTEAALFAAHAVDKNAVCRAWHDYLAICFAALDASIHVAADRYSRKRQVDLKKVGLDVLLPHMPTNVSFTPKQVVSWDLAGQRPTVIKRVLGTDLIDDIRTMTNTCQSLTEQMKDANLLGHYERHPTKQGLGCYTYRRVEVSEHRIGSQIAEQSVVERKSPERNVLETVRITKTLSGFEQNIFLVRYEHIYLGRDFPLPAWEVPAPRFVRKFISAVKEPWRSVMSVAAGHMLRETIQRSQHSSRRITQENITEEIIRSGRLYSPSVKLADASYVGWSGDDLVAFDLKKLFARS